MLADFILYALIAGGCVALAAGPLGCFVVWRKMSYFGDSLAHSALLGVALGFVCGIHPAVGTLLTSLVFGLLLVGLEHQRLLATDTLLGILAHSALSLGILCVSLLDRPELNLYGFLFGDILTVTPRELLTIALACACTLALLILFWSPLVLLCVHEDIARAEGILRLPHQLLLVLLMTIMVAVAVQIVGILLITSLLIVPAATARLLASTPERMAVLASLFGLLSVGGGIFISLQIDTPSGPTIVAMGTAIFLLSLPLSWGISQRAPHKIKTNLR